MGELIPEELRGIRERLIELADRYDLVSQAKDTCARWLHESADVLLYAVSEVSMDFRSHALVFRNAKLSYPYIDTRLDLSFNNREIGHYRLITRLDGSPENDYLIFEPYAMRTASG
jgi:hypothetical protein